MTQKVTILAVLALVALGLVPGVVLAQDGGNPLATAQAADRQADQARRGAAALEATAQAGYAQATQAARATATAQVIEAQQTATAQALQATQQAQAQQWTATARAWDAQAAAGAATREAASWATNATATAGAIEAQAQAQGVEATAAALRLERDQADRDAAQAWRPFRVYGGWLALLALTLAAAWVADRLITIWMDKRRDRARAEFEASIVEGETVARDRRRSVALIPPTAGWVPAYLRPKETRDGGRPA